MKSFDELLKAAFSCGDLSAADLPRLELYMDQILTLFDEGLADYKRRPEDKLLTKTMINNYSKEHLILPVRGKKYSREQLLQLLCIFNLKQNLTLGDIKTLTGPESRPVDYEAAYARSLELKERLKEAMPALLRETLDGGKKLSDAEETLAVVLALSSGATYLRRTCEALIDGLDGQGKS